MFRPPLVFFPLLLQSRPPTPISFIFCLVPSEACIGGVSGEGGVFVSVTRREAFNVTPRSGVPGPLTHLAARISHLTSFGWHLVSVFFPSLFCDFFVLFLLFLQSISFYLFSAVFFLFFFSQYSLISLLVFCL